MNKAPTQQNKRATYPAYKPSGIDWLGDVPEHWEVKRAKALLARNDGGAWGEDFDEDGIIVYVQRSRQSMATGTSLSQPNGGYLLPSTPRVVCRRET